MFECVLNISEGRNLEVLEDLSHCAGPSLRDRHSDPAHHRSVFTLINEREPLERDVRSLITCAMNTLTLESHDGVHPRLGVVDVVPFVALDEDERPVARELRDATARWVAHTFEVATFLYGDLGDGTSRSLPDVRRLAFKGLAPDFGPGQPSPTLGAVAVGERTVLVAWNIWLSNTTLDRAREMTKSLRGPYVRALGFEVGSEVQVSCNLLDVSECPPSIVFDLVESMLRDSEHVTRTELVGLAPKSLLDAEDPRRWAQLDLSPETTIEAASVRGSASL
jgi:glutamate formiminotransferase